MPLLGSKIRRALLTGLGQALLKFAVERSLTLEGQMVTWEGLAVSTKSPGCWQLWLGHLEQHFSPQVISISLKKVYSLLFEVWL